MLPLPPLSHMHMRPTCPTRPRVPAASPTRAGPLRGAMLGFYAAASDFTRRLTSVRANAKFSSPEAGADEPWDGKPERLREVVDYMKAK